MVHEITARQRIVSALTNLTATQGYERVLLRSVAECGRVSLRTFYQEFSDKEDCLIAVFEQWIDDAADVAVRAGEDATTTDDRLVSFLAALYGHLLARPKLSQAMIVSLLTGSERARAIRDHGADRLAEALRACAHSQASDDTGSGRYPLGIVHARAVVGSVFELAVMDCCDNHEDVAATAQALARVSVDLLDSVAKGRRAGGH